MVNFNTITIIFRSKINSGFNIKYIFSFLLISAISICAYSQTNKIKKTDGFFVSEYHVLSSDTSKKEGLYRLFYKNRIIENGSFSENKRTGKWQFFSLDGVLEYEYDFDSNKILRLSGKNSEDLKNKTPCLFLGSPLIPYLYIVNKMYYPAKARDKKIGGRVVLALKINSKGELWSMYLYKKLDPLLDKEVMRVARSFPASWQWLPATLNGKNIDGEYMISIEFDPEE